MPKLNTIQNADRLRTRIEQLGRGEEIAAKDLWALLTDQLIAGHDEAWQATDEIAKNMREKIIITTKNLDWNFIPLNYKKFANFKILITKDQANICDTRSKESQQDY